MSASAKEHAMIFTGDSVRAIFANTKTQTRRVISRRNSLVNGHPASAGLWGSLDFANAWIDQGPSPAGYPGPYLKVPKPDDESVHRVYPRVQVGDRLWVRETWSAQYEFPLDYQGDHVAWHHKTPPAWRLGSNAMRTYYRGDRSVYDVCDYGEQGIDLVRQLSHGEAPKWAPAIHMPRWASRLTMSITVSMPQRLQDISEADAIAEGLIRVRGPMQSVSWNYGNVEARATCRVAFEELWDSINAKRGHPWAANDWVWAYTFSKATS